MPTPSAAHRKPFQEAIELIARAASALEKRGIEPPILVGGAAVELFTASTVTTGDFDVVTPYREEFFEELLKVGFCRPAQGEIGRALFHEGTGFSIEVVSGHLLDGRADRERVSRIEFRDGALRLVPIEDMIADRMGQALAGPRRNQAMRDQAVWLYRFAIAPDRAYLDRRIREETVNEATVATLEAWEHEDD
jgi:hypothetical protein